VAVRAGADGGVVTTRIGVLTGGGDCAGLNAAIRAVVRRARQADVSVVGFEAGWRGVFDGRVTELTTAWTRGLLHRGGTALGTSRVDPYREPGGVDRLRSALAGLGVDGLVVIGGEGTLAAAHRVHLDGVPVIGIPKTIDNDVPGTDRSIGFATAVDVATDAADRLHTTAESHDRVQVLELMGRHAGWIAVAAGLAGGADSILIPEVPFDVDAVAGHLRHRAASGRDFSVVVVAEGARPVPGTLEVPASPTDEFGRPRLGGIGHVIGHELAVRTGFDVRVTVLGHVQRGGAPNASDRVLATQMGVRAVEAAVAGEWGTLVASRRPHVELVPLEAAQGGPALVPEELYRTAAVFFG
jgi:phosphofructokinase-like protein